MSSPISSITLTQSLLKGLACAALNPGLQSILVFDTSYEALNAMASALAQLLQAATGKEVERISLGVSEVDDDLWGSLTISTDERGDQSIRWCHGLLSNSEDNLCLRLIMINDLAKLSLDAARACVMLIGADVAHIERHGQHTEWKPQLCWLASCETSRVGVLSPHLLDRFSLRLRWQNTTSVYSMRDAHWLQEVLKDAPYVEATEYPLPSDLKEQVQQAAHRHPILPEEVCKYILEHTVSIQSSSLRREIALARLASAIAQLEHMDVVTFAHVAAAAQLIGLPAIAGPAKEVSAYTNSPMLPPLQESQGLPAGGDIDEQYPRTEIASLEEMPIPPLPESVPQQIPEQVYISDQPEEQPEVLLSFHTYPEDGAPVEREIASLQLPLQRYSDARSGRGVIIGVEPSDTLRDLAVVSTILTAAPYQHIRSGQLKQKGDSHHRPFLLSRSDLRRYRRAPTADSMLLILLDYTCLSDRDWRKSLLPYLVEAYIERASICIVQVGKKDAAHELRAEVVRGRNILVPFIDDALIDASGRATPLAHGFDLTLQTLRHALQHGRSTVHHVLLLVVSDGRGNVPLEDSRIGRITQPVSRRGIEDAFQVAQQLQDFRDVEKVLLNPQPEQYADLPLLLAEFMGAAVEDIPPLNREEAKV